MGQGFLFSDQLRAATLTGSTTAADLPVSNIADVQPRTRARFTGSPCNVVADKGAASSLDCVFVGSTDVSAAATIRVRTSQADATFAVTNFDSGTVSIAGGPAVNGQFVCLLPSAQNVRYVRVDITDTAPTDVGLLRGGLLLRPERAWDYGHAHGYQDGGIRDFNPRTGSQFGVDGARVRFRQFILPSLREAEIVGEILAADRDVGLARDILFIPDLSAAQADLNKFSIWGAWKPQGGDGSVRTSKPFFRRTFSMLERP